MLRSFDGWEGEHFSFGAVNAPAAASASAASPTSIAIDNSSDGPSATIPDSHLLFTAQFSRAGADLVLTGEDGKAFVVHDYFSTDVRARLLSAEGAALSPDVVAALAGPLTPGQYAQAGAAQPAAQAVGRVVQASGDATIVRNGVAMAAQAGEAILKGDVLQTVTGTFGVTFNDGSTLNLTANSRLVVNEFVYDPNGSANSQLLNLVQGSLTFISGEVAHNGDMKIGTPVATMAIRGTVGGVTTANDGTVNFYVSQSATGAVILDRSGTIIANVVQDGPLIIVRPVGPLQVLAEEIQKSPAQLAIELSALQQIVSIQAVGQQIIQQYFQPNPNTPNPNPQSTDKPHTQIQIELQTNPTPLNDPSHTPGDNAPPHQITATVTVITPPTGPGLPPTVDHDPIVVTVAAANVAPILDYFNLAIDHGGITLLSPSDYHVTDPDSSSFVFTVENVNGGVFQVWHGPAVQTFGFSTFAAEEWEDATSFTDADIAAGHVQFVPDGGNAAPTFSISVSDYISSSAALTEPTVIFTPPNSAPEAHASHVSVSEEGLDGGLRDHSGTPDTTNCTIATGTICATDADGDALTFKLGVPATALRSDGEPICWELDCGTLYGVADGRTIITVSIDEDTGAYCVELSGPIDHPNRWAEDVKNLRIPVTVSDGELETCTTLTVKIEDDSPRAADVSVNAVAGASALASVNIVIVLDVSGSMGTVDSPNEISRLDLAKSALDNLLHTQDATVNQVMVVAFSGGVNVYTDMETGNHWTDATTASAFIQGLNYGGGTNYTDAISATMNSWRSETTGPTHADKTLVYFISDGEPTLGQALNDEGALTTATWESFLAGEHVAASYAIGVSPNIDDTNLRPISWTSADPEVSPINLTDANGLDVTLQGTVPDAPTHNIFTATEAPVGFGADGGHIRSVEIDCVKYTFDGNCVSGGNVESIHGTSIEVTTELGGTFKFYFANEGGESGPRAGDWSYTPPASLAAPADEVFHYILTDNDGDKAGANITVSVTPADYVPPGNVAPAISSDGGGATAVISVGENVRTVSTVQAADADNDTVTYSIVSGEGSPDAALFEIDSETGVLRFQSAPDYENPADADQDNSYLVQVRAWDGQADDVQSLTINVADDDLENGTYLVSSGANTTDPGTLRSAILYANAHAGTTITFVYGSSWNGAWVINVNNLPTLTGQNTVIDGSAGGGEGAAQVLLQVDGGGRIFKIGADESPLDVTIRDISVRYGNVYGSQGESGLGGAIYVSDNVNLTIQDSYLTENQARGGDGGGSGLGGAIYVGEGSNINLAGRVVINQNSVIAGTEGVALGAGIYMAGVDGVLTMSPPEMTKIEIVNDIASSAGGAPSLVIDGAGTVYLDAANGFSGATIIESGTLDIGRHGSLLNSDIQVESDGILTGGGFTPGEASGTGAVTVFSGGTLNPGWTGDSSGPTTAVFRTGSLTLFSGATFAAEIAGATTPGAYSLPGMIVGFDQILVNGSVSLGGATLDLYTSRSNTIGAPYTLIDNDGMDAVVGTFAGLQEGAKFTTGALAYRVTYTGGDGNDVVVTRIDNTAPVSGDASISTVEDTPKVLALGDFGPYSDAESGAIAAVKIVSLPTNGTLQYFDGDGWSAATGDQEISAPEIAAGHVRFLPDSGESGDLYATLSFKVGDGANFSANAYALTVHVTPEIVDPGELVANGGFELNFLDGNGVTQFNSWTLANATGNESSSVGPQHSGDYDAALHSNDPEPVTLSQIISTALGTHYTLSFWLRNVDFANDFGQPDNSFSATWNGLEILSLTDARSSNVFTHYVFDVVGTADESVLQFAGYNPTDYWRIDDVSVREGAPPNQAPVFDASGIAATFGLYSVTASGVTLSDADAGNETLTGSITAEYGTVALAGAIFGDLTGSGTGHLSGQGTLDEINDALAAGVVYTPNLITPPATDKVTLAVNDGHGGTDSLTFVFAVTQVSGLLEGGSGKDVIVSTAGDDTLTGHDGADTFVFGPYAGAANNDVVTDFSGHGDGDIVMLTGFNAANFDDLLLEDVLRDNVHDTVVHAGQNAITLQNVNYLTLTAADFIFHPVNPPPVFET